MNLWVHGKVQQKTVDSSTPVRKAVDDLLCAAWPEVAPKQLHSRVQRVECVEKGEDRDLHGWEAMESPVGVFNYDVYAEQPDLVLPGPNIMERLETVEKEAAAARAEAAAAKEGAAAAKEEAAAARAETAAARVAAAAGHSPQVVNLAAQIAMLAVGAQCFRTTQSDRFSTSFSSSAFLRYLSRRGVQDAAMRSDSLVTDRNAAVHPAPRSELEAEVERVRAFITPELRDRASFECLIVEEYKQIYEECKEEGFRSCR